MLGAIVGDIVGSVYEWHNIKVKDFPLFTTGCSPTDDFIMTLAVAKALIESKNDGYHSLSDNVVKYMQEIGRKHFNCGFGGKFRQWIKSNDPQPYGSFGNGSAMRVSPMAYVAETMEECIRLADAVTIVTHDHPEGIKGGRAAAIATWLALHGSSKEDIRQEIEEHYYPLDFTIDGIRPTYTFDVTCQGSVPQAIEAFMESSDFEDAIRTAISIGGDSDTIAAITGAIAGACYGIPDEIATKAYEYLSTDIRMILDEFESQYGVE